MASFAAPPPYCSAGMMKPICATVHTLKKEMQKPSEMRMETIAGESPLELSTILRRPEILRLRHGFEDAVAASESAVSSLTGLSLPMLGLLALCVFAESSKCLLANWERETKAVQGRQPPFAPFMIFIKNLLSLSLLLLISALWGGRHAVKQAISPRRVLLFWPFAFCFAASQVCALLALKSFDAGSLKVFAQVQLPLTALLSHLIFGRRYSHTQWQAVAFLGLCSTAFMEVRILFETGAPSPLELLLGLQSQPGLEGDGNLTSALWPGGSLEGLGYVMATVVLGCLASVFGEKLLKKDIQAPYYVQKCNLMVGETGSALLMLLLGPQLGLAPTSQSAFSFEDWDWRSCVVVTVWLLHGWIAGMVAKRLSALTKSLANILSAVVTYAGATALWPRAPFFPRCVPAALSAVLVFLGVFMFATVRPLKWKDQHERRRTAFMRQLRSWTRSCCLEQVLGGRFVLLVAFVLLDATRPLLGSWAQQGDNSVRAFQSGSFMLAQTSVSFLVAIAIAWPLQGSLRAAVKLCFRPNAFFRQLPCAICFTVSKLSLLMALARLDAGTVRVMAQLGLPMVAIGSKWFMRKHYTREQWQAIWMIVIGVVTFYLVKTETEHHAADYALHRPWPPREIDEAEPAHPERSSFLVLTSWELQVIVSLASNCLGALISERFLKDHDQGPYYAMKAHLLGGECIVNFTMCLGSWMLASHHTSFGSHLRAGWDHRTVVTMLVWIPSGWCATLVVRRCCALTKNIAQSAGSMLTYVFSIRPVTLIEPALDSQPVKMPVVLLALVSMHSVILFVVASEEQKSQEKQRMEGGDDSLAIEHHELSDSERGAASFVQHYTTLKPPAGAKGRISRISTTAADLYDLANPQDAQESPKISTPHMAKKAH